MTMLARLLSSWRSTKLWRKEHIEAFSRVSRPSAEGITPFQIQFLAAIDGIIPRSAFETTQHSDGTVHFVAPIPGVPARLFVYDTEASIYGPALDLRFEEWDYRTPEELIAATSKAIGELHAT